MLKSPKSSSENGVLELFTPHALEIFGAVPTLKCLLFAKGFPGQLNMYDGKAADSYACPAQVTGDLQPGTMVTAADLEMYCVSASKLDSDAWREYVYPITIKCLPAKLDRISPPSSPVQTDRSVSPASNL